MSLQMKLNTLQEECQTSGEELKEKVETIVKLNDELSSLKEQQAICTEENKVLRQKVCSKDFVRAILCKSL